ncbi:hypothetical protein [Streptomyces parvus]|uniref:hypothetical protein n=1 Tax=Streptomyces parvus TaxID=66428 RepID=UPI00363D37ED
MVPDAVREGHRRRARTRAFAVAGAFVAVTAVTLSLSVPGPWLSAGPDTEPASPAGPSLSLTVPTSSPSPQRTEPRPDMPSPTSIPAPTESAPVPPGPPAPTRSAPPGLGPQEARRLAEFRQRAAEVLGALRPASIGTVVPAGDDPGSYRARRDDVVHAVRLSVRTDQGSADQGSADQGSADQGSADQGSAAPACRDIPQKGLTCASVPLDDGTPAQAYRQPTAGRGTEVSLRYRSGRSTVALSVPAARSGAGGAPVTAGDLVRVAQDPRFRELIAYADADPVAWSGAAS